MSVSPSVDMLPFSVTIPAAVPQRSEIPEGLKNYPVFKQKEVNVIEEFYSMHSIRNLHVSEDTEMFKQIQNLYACTL